MNDNHRPHRYHVKCIWCGAPTLDVVNRCCFRCLHLVARITRDLPIARRIVDAIERGEQP